MTAPEPKQLVPLDKSAFLPGPIGCVLRYLSGQSERDLRFVFVSRSFPQ